MNVIYMCVCRERERERERERQFKKKIGDLCVERERETI